MSTLYSNQYSDAYVEVPSSKVNTPDLNGNIKMAYFDFTISAAPADGDVLKLCKLPKGARVLDVEISAPDLGTAGVLNIGWAASAELDSAGSAVEAADADGFMVSVDVNAAAATQNMADASGAAVPGYLKKFSAEVDVQIAIATAWTATSGTIKGYIKYAV
jgi:hypothetical protein